jgi:Tol biopolymer transport system component/tRNA A-37 threonylcarbamoyl transferase component Bud32
MTRFQREAQLLAALNHPNIAAIYGLEDAPSTGSGHAGVRAIVMELVDGQTLTGPMPMAEALPIAKQIAEALEYAHERGIIHRDLKPANIKLTRDGTVKVLDFGLAKAMDEASDLALSLHGSMSPTLSLAATHAGIIMGTAGYMAPEQAKGKGADRRSDIWSFGIVLYELLTGSRMFGGDTVPETLASVMKDQLTFEKLPDETPSAIRKLLARCLERDPRRRLQSIGEARIVIEDVIAGVAADEHRPLHAAPAARVAKWPFVVAALGLTAAMAVLGWAWTRPAPAPGAVTRFTVIPPQNVVLTNTAPNAAQMAVSPDGRYVAFVADEPGRARTIWIRALDSLVAQRLDRTDGADMPFWSPDSRHIAYFANGSLMRVSIAGGAAIRICDANDPEGGTWFQGAGQEDVIVFAPDASGPLQRVPAQGGVPAPVTALADGESGHSFPQFLPGGRRFLYLAEGNTPGIYVHSLDTGERTFVLASIGRAVWSPPGLLLYLRDGTLLAQRWDLDTLRLHGEPVAIAEDVRNGAANGRNGFSVSTNGALAYRTGGGGGRVQIRWHTRDGKPGPVALETGVYGQIELSPDDRHLSVVTGLGDDRNIWLKDLGSGTFSPLTTAGGAETDHAWSPDSRRVAYVGQQGGQFMLFETLIGSGTHTPVPIAVPHTLEHWHDRTFVIRNRSRVSLLDEPGAGSSTPDAQKPRMILEASAAIDQIRVSPNGKWVAYTSFESGQAEVWLAAFPTFTNRRQISTGSGAGAVQALWRGDSKELFFVSRDRQMMTVDIPDGPPQEPGSPRRLFETGVNSTAQVHMYAVTRDGKRFLIREGLGNEADEIEPLYIVTNWTSLLR